MSWLKPRPPKETQTGAVVRTWGAAVLRPYVTLLGGRVVARRNGRARHTYKTITAEKSARGFAIKLADMGRSRLRPYMIAVEAD